MIKTELLSLWFSAGQVQGSVKIVQYRLCTIIIIVALYLRKVCCLSLFLPLALPYKNSSSPWVLSALSQAVMLLYCPHTGSWFGELQLDIYVDDLYGVVLCTWIRH